MGLDPVLEQKFSAVPVHTPRRHSGLSLDSRLAKKFLRSKRLSPEERTMLSSYVVTAKWIPEERAVYAAAADGFSTIPELSTVTGLSISQVESVISKLESRGTLRRVSGV